MGTNRKIKGHHIKMLMSCSDIKSKQKSLNYFNFNCFTLFGLITEIYEIIIKILPKIQASLNQSRRKTTRRKGIHQ